ncbi:MAG: signal recognition particle-docking protein FtsY [Desulfobacterota bacterium]|nr:signal recognition particle-docking protein FtsY [Thermodesulfobacteriota bacterium]MDW8001642.1 signal recognition particle-docking protein FtsY [Deltaproteobacteria bacterium]
MSLFEKLKEGLKKTRDQIKTRIEWAIRGTFDESVFNEIEEALILSDCGVDTSSRLVEQLKERWKRGYIKDEKQLKVALRDLVEEILKKVEEPLYVDNFKPFVILTLGVNGVGKTTTIAKLAKRLKDEKKSVLLGACDTFRAAAIDQISIWAQRVGVDIVKSREGSDPASVAYDTLKAAKAREMDVVILDTAGRLHTKHNLVEEIKKIKRVIAKEISEGPHETMLVLDATNGQNAIQQVKSFHDALHVTGLTVAKLDGTAKGGFILPIAERFKIPIRYVATGEKLEDLSPFSAKEFARALFED